MAYTRNYRTVVPLDPGTDLEVARWLARESFERKAAGDCLQIIEYTEAEVGADEIPPKVGKQLPRPLTDYLWFEFSAVATAVTSA